MTAPGTTVGTLSYMSPEQIMGKTADGRADFFALGIILYELLAGRKPFIGDNLSTIVYKIVHEEPQRVTDINQSLPPGYEDVIRRALAKNPDDRYQSGREMIADLENPGNIAEASRAYNLKTGAGLVPGGRKKRPFALAGGLLLLAAAAGVVYVLVSQDAGKSPNNTVSQNMPKTQEAVPSPPAEKILSEFPGDASGRDDLNKAKGELTAARVASLLQTGIAGYKSGNYAACVQDMESVLRMDGDNKEAQDYLFKADTALSKKEILAMIERRSLAEENEDLETLLSDLDSGSLASKQRDYYRTIFTIYDGIDSSFKGKPISISFSGRTHASVNFWHAIRGVSGKDKQVKPIYFGSKRWEMEKRGKIWKIVDIIWES